MRLGIDNYEEVYKEIIDTTYQCAILNKKFKEHILPKDEFLKLCLSDKRNLCTWGKLMNLVNTKRNFSGMNIKEFLDNYLTKKFKDDYSLILANFISIIEAEDTSHSQLIYTFMDLNLAKESGIDYFLYILHFVQHKKKIFLLHRQNERIEEIYFELFMKTFKENIKEEHKEKTIKIIGEDYFKIFFLHYFDDYMERIRLHEYMLHENDLEVKLIFFINNFNTYKWLDEMRKNFLFDLGKTGKIFYREHYESLNGENKNHYLSEMTISSIENNAIIV